MKYKRERKNYISKMVSDVESILNEIDIDIITNEFKKDNYPILGEVLGRGGSRTVYRLLGYDDIVVKVEERGFQNIYEWSTYLDLEYTVWNKCIANLHFISTNGKVILQEYAKDISTRAEMLMFYNTRYPNVFTDIKVENLGRIEDRIVFRDYGMSLRPNIRNKSFKPKDFYIINDVNRKSFINI